MIPKKKKAGEVIQSHSKQVLGVEGITVPTINLSAGGVGLLTPLPGCCNSGNESWYPLCYGTHGSTMTEGK